VQERDGRERGLTGCRDRERGRTTARAGQTPPHSPHRGRAPFVLRAIAAVPAVRASAPLWSATASRACSGARCPEGAGAGQRGPLPRPRRGRPQRAIEPLTFGERVAVGLDVPRGHGGGVVPVAGRAAHRLGGRAHARAVQVVLVLVLVSCWFEKLRSAPAATPPRPASSSRAGSAAAGPAARGRAGPRGRRGRACARGSLRWWLGGSARGPGPGSPPADEPSPPHASTPGLSVPAGSWE
jgi:hypothetical protein